MLVAIADIVVDKQLGEEQNGLNFLFIALVLFSWCFWTVMSCSFCIYNETLFFSVSKHRIYLVWNQVVGTLSGFFTLSMLLIEGFVGEASNQLYQCGSIVSTATNVLDCYLEDQCLFKLNFVAQ